MTTRPNLLVIRVADLETVRKFYNDLRIEKHGGPEHFTHANDCFVFEVYPRWSVGPFGRTS